MEVSSEAAGSLMLMPCSELHCWTTRTSDKVRASRTDQSLCSWMIYLKMLFVSLLISLEGDRRTYTRDNESHKIMISDTEILMEAISMNIWDQAKMSPSHETPQEEDASLKTLEEAAGEAGRSLSSADCFSSPFYLSRDSFCSGGLRIRVPLFLLIRLDLPRVPSLTESSQSVRPLSSEEKTKQTVEEIAASGVAATLPSEVQVEAEVKPAERKERFLFQPSTPRRVVKLEDQGVVISFIQERCFSLSHQFFRLWTFSHT